MPSPVRPHVRRRRRMERAEREAAILEAAFTEFATNGFAAARLDDLAARLGIAKGTLYLYFPSKEALFEAAVRRRLAEPLAAIEAQAMTAAEGRDALSALFNVIAVLGRAFRQPDSLALLRLLVSEAHRFPQLGALYHRAVARRGLAAIRRVLEAGEARGELRAGAARELPQLLVAPLLQAALWRLIFGPARIPPMDGPMLEAAHREMLARWLQAQS
jgi:AcrR family transcriptional regulator